MVTTRHESTPLVLHVINHLVVGGLENGLVNLINWMPESHFRHAIVCISHFDSFRERIQKEVPVVALEKRSGKDLGVYARFRRAVKELRPDIVHTRNLASLEFCVPAALLGVRARVHGEHGRDVWDLDGTNVKYRLLRKIVRPFVSRFVAVSKDLEHWLVESVGVRAERVSQIYNGVDARRFSPRAGERPPLAPSGFLDEASVVIGTVGRLHEVKDQLTLTKAFIELARDGGEAGRRLRLVIVGDGPLRGPALSLLQEAGIAEQAWLPGERGDIPEVLRALDLFVLPSLREGISNTILEAMATGLPVVATRVGGNPEIVREEVTGRLVPAQDPPAMATCMRRYIEDRESMRAHGLAGRAAIEADYSMEAMVDRYEAVYHSVLGKN